MTNMDNNIDKKLLSKKDVMNLLDTVFKDKIFNFRGSNKFKVSASKEYEKLCLTLDDLVRQKVEENKQK
tara:strand:+ start:3671 stop:3877 length:207 start_codon:yes stop_codon:yes gene_type:complete